MRSEKTGSQILNLSLDDTVAALLLQPGQHCVAAASVQAGEGHDGDLQISENVRNAVDEVDKNVWNKEIQVSRALEEVDNLMKQVYTMALQHDLRNASGKLVSIPIDTFKVGTELEADVYSTKNELVEMGRIARADTLSIERELPKAVEMRQIAEQQVQKMDNNLIDENIEAQRIAEETTSFKEEIVLTETAMNQNLSKLKEEIICLKSKKPENQKSIEALHKELNAAKKDLERIATKRDALSEEGKTFLRNASERTISHIERVTAKRNMAALKCKEKITKQTEKILKEAAEIESRVSMVIGRNNKS